MRALRYLHPSLYWLLLMINSQMLVTTVSTKIDKQNVKYISPLPGAQLVSKETNIIVRYKQCIPLPERNFSSFFHVQGSISGEHNGKAIISDDNRTVIFKIVKNFEPGEIVSVQLPANVPHVYQEELKVISYSFQIFPLREKLSPEQVFSSKNKNQDFDFKNYNSGFDKSVSKVRTINDISLPNDFPSFKIMVNDNPDSGYIFMNNWEGTSYIMILDNSAKPIFYKQMPGRASDFKVQPTGILTHYFTGNLWAFVAMDSTYTVIDTFQCQNGYATDEHELQILPNGHALLIANDYQIFDMSQIVSGGKPNAKVFGDHVQELDKEKNVIFEWRCWDHFNVTDAIHENLTAATIDMVHMNAVDLDHDGNILISSRNLSEITKINRETGEIMWRLGGANNEFTFVNDPHGISYQHSIRALPNENYLLFDNGSYHSPPFSRAVEYQLDVEQKTATLVWEYRNNPDYYTESIGNVQRLSNGNILINWGGRGLPKLAEIRPDGSMAYELDFILPIKCYRTFRFPWKGKAIVPYLLTEPRSDGVKLLFNKFGDSNVMKYIIYGGESPKPTTKIDSTQNTSIELTDLTTDTSYYFRVTAIDSSSHESGYSNEVSVLTRFVERGDNLIRNGDFSSSSNFWELITVDDAIAEGKVTNLGEYHLNISNGGPRMESVQLRQNNIEVVRERTYLFEFDAYAANPRIVNAMIAQSFSPWLNYGRIGSSYFTPIKKHFSYQFEMQDQTDYQARVAFDCGSSNDDVFIDNVSFKEVITFVKDENSHFLPLCYELLGNYPNPFNSKTKIRYAVPAKSDIKIIIYNILGKFVEESFHHNQEPGIHEIIFSASSLSSGIYFCSMEARSISNSFKFNDVLKMIVIK
jgi:hypothetical protein